MGYFIVTAGKYETYRNKEMYNVLCSKEVVKLSIRTTDIQDVLESINNTYDFTNVRYYDDKGNEYYFDIFLVNKGT